MYSLFFSVSLLLLIQTQALDMSQLLTSSYSQVSHSNSARSNAEQSSVTSSGKNLFAQKKNSRRYSAGNTNDKSRELNVGSGELIQERFNPKPWIGYEAELNKKPSYISPLTKQPNSDFSVPFDSFPLPISNNKEKSSLLKTLPAVIPTPLSAVTSTNENFPPLLPTPDSPFNSHENSKPASNFKSEISIIPNMEFTLEKKPVLDYVDHQEDYNHYDNNHPDTNHHDETVPEHESHDLKFSDYSEHNFNVHDNSFNHHFVHDHPMIYYEVKPPPQTEAPENERLNKRPYSYYYIGRKLYYVPLYFSVYFIIYIFVLILKSIARHKITFNHYFEEDKREMKDIHDIHEEHVHELDHQVSNDIITAKRKYIM